MADVAKRRCLFISNIPPSISSSNLEVFLLQELELFNQDRRHLVKVIFPVNESTPSLALATFQDEKAMVALMRKRLVYEGQHLTMQPFLSHVFSSMSAVVNPDVTNLFPFISPDFSRLIEKQTGVECHQLDEKERNRWMHISQISSSQDLYMLTGNWFQLQNARKFMQEWVVDETKRSQFMDHSYDTKEETKQNEASSSDDVNSRKEKDLFPRENGKPPMEHNYNTGDKRNQKVTSSSDDVNSVKQKDLLSRDNGQQFIDHNYNTADKRNQKIASSSGDVNSLKEKNLLSGENRKQERTLDEEQTRSSNGKVDNSTLYHEDAPKPDVDSHSVITEPTRSMERSRQRSSLNGQTDSRKGSKDGIKTKREGKTAKVACTFGGESLRLSSRNRLEQDDLQVDEDVAMTHQPMTRLNHHSTQDGAIQKDLSPSQDVLHHSGLAQHAHSASQNMEHFKNHLAEGMIPHLPHGGVAPTMNDDSKIHSSSSVDDRRREDDQSRREMIPSFSAASRSLKSSNDELKVGPSLDYLKHVKVPQTLPSSFDLELNRSEGVGDDLQRIGDITNTVDNAHEDKLLHDKNASEVGHAEPRLSNFLVGESRIVDEQDTEPTDSLESIPVDPGVFSYILLKQSNSIRDIEERYGVKFSMLTTSDGSDADVESAMLKIKPLRETADIAKAHDKFVDMYSNVFSNLSHRVVPLADITVNPESLRQTVDSIHECYDTVLLSISHDKVLIYGPHEINVSLAKQWITAKLKKMQQTDPTDISAVGRHNTEHACPRGTDDKHSVDQEAPPRPNYQTRADRHDTQNSLTRGGNNLPPIHQEQDIKPQSHNDVDGQVGHLFTRMDADGGSPGERVAGIPKTLSGAHEVETEPTSSKKQDNGHLAQMNIGFDYAHSSARLQVDRPSEDDVLDNEQSGDPKRTTPSLDAGPIIPSLSNEALRSMVTRAADEVTELNRRHRSEEAGSMTEIIPVDPGVFAYIQAKKHTILCDIQQNYGIQFTIQENLDSDVSMIKVDPVGAVTDRAIQEGKEAFTNFYSEVFSGLEHRAISLGDFENVSREALQEILEGVEHSFSDLLFQVVGSRVLIYGQGLHNVETARDYVLRQLCGSLKSLSESLLQVDLEESMESLTNEGMMSRLNHLRYGSLSPEALKTELKMTPRQIGNVPEVSGQSVAEMIDQTTRRHVLMEEANNGRVSPKHHLTSPVEELHLNERQGRPKLSSHNESVTPLDVPNEVLHHMTVPSTSSYSQNDRVPRDEKDITGNVYRFIDDRLIVEMSSGIRVQVYRSDITRVAVDAVVSAANEQLMNIGGVAAAIHKAAGYDVQADCNRQIARHGLLYPSQVFYTGAGKLLCKFILHAVGPRWEGYAKEQECRQTLRSTVVNCLRTADQKLQVTSLALPLISSGIFGVPLEICMEEICKALRDHNDNQHSINIIKHVHIVDLDNTTVQKAQDVMITTLCESSHGSDEADARHSCSSQHDSFSRDHGGYEHLREEYYHLEKDVPLRNNDKATWSRTENKSKRTSARSTGSSRRQYDSSDEDLPPQDARMDDHNFSFSRPALVRSSSLPYLSRGDTDDTGTTRWSSGTTGISTAWSKNSTGLENIRKKHSHGGEMGQRSIGNSRTTSKVSSKYSRKEDRIKDLLETHSKAPLSPEQTRKTQHEINRLLTEEEVGTRAKQRPKRRTQSLDRSRTRYKCFVCSSTLKLSKRISCEHHVCEICKLARLDVGRCKECSKVKSKKEKVCELCNCSTPFMLLKCRCCDNSVCIQCVKKGMDTCRGCVERVHPLNDHHGERRQPKFREPIVAGTRPSLLDTKKVYRIKTGVSDSTTSRNKPMLGLNQVIDVAQSYSAADNKIGSEIKRSGHTRSAFSQEIVTEEAPHDEILRHLSREQTARSQIPRDIVNNHTSVGDNLETRGRISRKQSGRARGLKVVGKSSPLVSRQQQVTCVICMDTLQDPKELSKCKHTFCSECIDKAFKFKPVCPICGVSYGKLQGDQPDGTMTYASVSTDLPGHTDCGTIIINFEFRDGVQTEQHENPGMLYSGTYRQAFLPNSREGNEILKLLKRAFDARLLFTIGRSVTTGVENVVVWNDVHLKTRQTGGAENHGYPDRTYLQRVRDELEAKGIK